MPKIGTNKKGKSRKKGETVKEVAELIIKSPDISTNQLAEKIGVTNNNIRFALNKLKKEPEWYATRFQMDANAIVEALETRDLRAARKCSQKPKWRGKANWPACKTATKKSLSDIEFVRACGQHYTFNVETQKYVGDQCVSYSGSPGLPRKITLTKMQNMS